MLPCRLDPSHAIIPVYNIEENRTRHNGVFFEEGKINVNELMKSLVIEDRGHPKVEVGDTVKVHVRIVEGNRERIQVFQGVVIRARKGGNDANFTVRRIASHGVGVERTFLLQSPRIEKIEITRRDQSSPRSTLLLA
jgi:ribosomal protein L19